jgi:hypothetical protein
MKYLRWWLEREILSFLSPTIVMLNMFNIPDQNDFFIMQNKQLCFDF